MIDLTAIETDIAVALSGLGFVSIEPHRIREVVPITLMPALDIECQGHKEMRDARRHYAMPTIIAIRNKGVDREDNSIAFKAFVRNVVEILEHLRTERFDIIANISSDIGSGDNGNGGYVRAVVITCEPRKD